MPAVVGAVVGSSVGGSTVGGSTVGSSVGESSGVAVGFDPDGGASVVLTGMFFCVRVGVAVGVADGNAVAVIHAVSLPPRPTHKSYRASQTDPIPLAPAQEY